VTDLVATGAASPGAGLVGVDAIAGAPTAIAAGTLRAALVTLLGGLNGHVNQASGAHAASAVSVADSGNNLNAANVEAALAEILDAVEGDHFRGNEANAGQHRAIRQPPLGGTKALILDSNASGAAATHLRIYADGSSVWFTLNASWDGAQWVRDSGGTFCGAFRFARNEIEFLHEDSFAATFTTWTRTWRLPMSSTVNSAFELTGTVREVGRVGMEWSNADSATRSLAGGGSVTFRNRFPATPSSITFSALNTSSGFSGSPSSYFADRDGFGVFSYQTMAGTLHGLVVRHVHRDRVRSTDGHPGDHRHRARPALRRVRSREPRRTREPRGRRGTPSRSRTASSRCPSAQRVARGSSWCARPRASRRTRHKAAPGTFTG
jgi:hypothetical protein